VARLLIVDDERLIQELLSRLLRADGHDCEAVGNVDDARDALAGDGFDLVICDIDMPGGSGFDLVREVRSAPGGPAFLMMSGIEDARLAAEAVDLGVEGYMLKPFELEEARRRVADIVARRANPP
jgi:two-component system, OmpR family, response regulator